MTAAALTTLTVAVLIAMAAVAADAGSAPTTALTSAEVRRITRRARRHGYQADSTISERLVSVACPRCGDRVHAVREARPASRGPLYESAVRALDRAMTAHLASGWCVPAQGGEVTW